MTAEQLDLHSQYKCIHKIITAKLTGKLQSNKALLSCAIKPLFSHLAGKPLVGLYYRNDVGAQATKCSSIIIILKLSYRKPDIKEQDGSSVFTLPFKFSIWRDLEKGNIQLCNPLLQSQHQQSSKLGIYLDPQTVWEATASWTYHVKYAALHRNLANYSQSTNLLTMLL